MRELFQMILEKQKKGEDTVLVTVLQRTGSAPRGKGSMMLVDKKGYLAGTVGGGKVENLAIDQAGQCLTEKFSTAVPYLLAEMGDNAIGMACGGDILIGFQYVAADDGVMAAELRTVLQTVEERKSGDYVISTESYGTFEIPFTPPPRAIIFGGGHIAKALAPIMRSLGFMVTVMDDRLEFVTQERFPGCQTICGDYDRVDEYITIMPDDYIMIMTNGHMGDFSIQSQILPKETAYVGVVGSKKKIATVNGKLKEEGLTDDMVNKVYTPIGLDIKAVTPAEIAVSIAAEIIQEKAKRTQYEIG